MATAIELPSYCCEHISKSTLKGLKSHDLKPSGSTYFSSQYACLQCPVVGELRELDKHFNKSKHEFACGSNSLYCGTCKDLVYNLNLVEASSKKRKIAQLSDEDDAYVTANINQRPCGREGVRGFFNLGETCYMNTILQMMVHNRLLSGYFLGMGHPLHTCPISNQPDKRVESDSEDDELDEQKPEIKPCIACAFTEIFTESRMADQTVPAHAVNLLYASWKTIDHMAGKGQCDSQEWFMMIVDRLHESTTAKVDESGLCSCFFHKAFYGRLQSEVICDTCNTSSSNLEAFSSISLDFKKQAKKKRKALPDTKTVVPSIMECLQSYTGLEPLSSEGYHCRGCGTPQTASKQLQLCKLPAILCIHVKRFGIKQTSPFNEEKYEGKIDFPLSLDMAPYTTRSRKVSGELLYDLESVIVHQGEQISNGHYYAFCRQDDRWFRFDDEIVSATTVEDVLRQDAYLLFYTARSVGDEPAIVVQ